MIRYGSKKIAKATLSERFTVALYLSYDITNSPTLKFYNFIINPANEALIGTKQPYFPVGGPVPPFPKDGKVLSSSKWGG